jgi:hypothetical protein
MAENLVALKLPLGLVEELQAELGTMVQVEPETQPSGGEFEAIVPQGMKKTIGGAAILVTVLLQSGAAAAELATAINDYVERTGETVQIMDPTDGKLVKKVVSGVAVPTIQQAIETSCG